MLKVYLQRKQAADEQELQPHDTGLDTVRQDESEAGQGRDEPSSWKSFSNIKSQNPRSPEPTASVEESSKHKSALQRRGAPKIPTRKPRKSVGCLHNKSKSLFGDSYCNKAG